ncbi:MAG: hypothetical protein ACM3U2_02355 [Deltaproteobacteria bacterium]
MIDLKTFVLLAGLLHFVILFASALVPKVLDWRGELRKLPPLFAQLVWVHGGFIVLTIIGLGGISVANAAELASGTLLARSVCGFIALFWATRLAVQFFYFDPGPYLATLPLKLGYHGLSVVFTCLTIIYTLSALGRQL